MTENNASGNPLMPQNNNNQPVQPERAKPQNKAPQVPQVNNAVSQQQTIPKPPIQTQQIPVQSQAPVQNQIQNQPQVQPQQQKQEAQLPPKQPLPPQSPQQGVNLGQLTDGVSPQGQAGIGLQAQPQSRKPQVKNIQKKGSKVSIRGFIIGCFIFLTLVFGIIGVGLYFIIQNPDQIGGNINIDTVKQGLRIFAVLFFAFLFLFGFGSIVVNGFRLSTVKEGSKIGYVFGVFFGLIVTILSIAGGIIVLQNINQIAGSDTPRTNNIVLAKVPTKEGPRYFHNSPGLQVIAPMSLSYELNPAVYDRTIINTIGGNEVRGITLDCGNEQSLQGNPSTYLFVGNCLYTQKGSYPLSLIITHVDRTSGVQQETVIPAGTLPVASEITIGTPSGPYQLNDARTEISVGKAPSKVLFDANKVFADFSIEQFEMDWDLDGDGSFDRTDDVSFAFNYKKAGVNTLYYNIPALGNYLYEIKFRVEQSDVPICEVLPRVVQESTYNLIVQCDDLSTPITEYNFEILDLDGRSIATEKTKRPLFRYAFPGGGSYVIKLSYITNEGKIGLFESESLEIGSVLHDVDFIPYYKAVNQDKYELISNEQTNKTYRNSEETIIVTELPMDIKINIESITPLTTLTTPQVLFNGQPILPTNEREFSFTIREQGEQEAIIRITEGDNEDGTTEIVIPIEIKQSSVLGRVLAVGGTVGFDPFEVKFDASTTDITDPDDEIIFFTWDFGNGETQINTSQSIITHTYTYDYENENGEFYPSLTIKTKKGLEETIPLDDPILVKKKLIKATVRSDSHLSQIGVVGERITLNLTTDGDPVKVLWEFGDGQTLECDSRSCLEPTVIYETPGTYSVKATITFSDSTETIADPFKLIIDAE